MEFDNRNLSQNFRFCGRFVGLVAVGNEIMIGYVFGVAIGDNQVAKTIVAEVGQQGRPAPVGLGHSAHETNLAESRATH